LKDTKFNLSRQELFERLILSQKQILVYSKDFAQIYRKERERRIHLEETHNKLKAIVNSISDAMVATDNNLVITEFNKAFENIIEKKPENIQGSSIVRLLPIQDLTPKINQFKTEDSTVLTLEFSINSLGESVYLATVTKTVSQQTERSGFVFVLRDITENKRLEKLRTSLFTFASNEIKTPLNGLIGVLNYLYSDLKTKLNEDESAHFRFLIESGENLEKIMEDLMRLSPLASQNDSEVSPVELNETIKSAIANIDSESYRLKVQIQFEKSDNVYILADKILFNKAVENIIKNLVFCSHQNSVLKINLVQNQSEMEIQCKNSTVNEEKARNFKKELKTQNDHEINKQGINLALAKDIVEWNGGKFQIRGKKSLVLVIKFSNWNSEFKALMKD